MLMSLFVKNFAIIDNIEVDFSDRMTVLTGETGAGKSLIIDAIGLLFGARSKADLIRYGETKATIEGTFSLINDKVKEILESLDIDIDDVLTIKREIYDNGKSICKVNGNAITLNNLSLLAEEIGDIHTQFDTQILANPKNYLSIIDNEEIISLLDKYKELLKEYKKADKNYQDLIDKKDEDSRKIEFLKYQINELEKAKLSETEEEDIKQKIKYLSNYEKIVSLTEELTTYLEKNNALDNLYQALTSIKKLTEYDETYKKFEERLSSAYYDLSDVSDEIKTKITKFDFDENEYNLLNDRLGLYSELKRKYKMTTKEIISYYDSIKEEIEKITNYEMYLSDAKKQRDDLYEKTYHLAKEISDKRKTLGVILKNSLIESLKELELNNTKVEISFTESKSFKTNGIDEVDFLVSFNKGEPVKPLSKVASGGELSRFMLALKSILASKLTRQLLIFDEIDNGVSGKIAYSIAKKIKTIADYAQVLCVTHLPQVASIADHHWHISKKLDDSNRTITKIKCLSLDEREKEIASMISNGTITEASLSLAKELLKK